MNGHTYDNTTPVSCLSEPSLLPWFHGFDLLLTNYGSLLNSALTKQQRRRLVATEIS
jgi:hypothetical protein